MKKIILIILFFPVIGQAINLQVIGACSDIPVYDIELELKIPMSLGDFTIDSFNKLNIPYIGNAKAINSILDFPIGLDALEVINDTTMRAHGPCFKIDGVIPEDFPQNVLITKVAQTITWFIGYSTLIKDKWVGQCEPTSKISPSDFCSN